MQTQWHSFLPLIKIKRRGFYLLRSREEFPYASIAQRGHFAISVGIFQLLPWRICVEEKLYEARCCGYVITVVTVTGRRSRQPACSSRRAGKIRALRGLEWRHGKRRKIRKNAGSVSPNTQLVREPSLCISGVVAKTVRFESLDKYCYLVIAKLHTTSTVLDSPSS